LASVITIFVLRVHRGGLGWWILMIPLALVVIGAIVELVKSAMASRERKALIDSGVDPDTVAKKAPTLR
jgi:hypothetical protein